MASEITTYLPEDYGSVITNLPMMPVSATIGIVIPTFSRLDFLKQTLKSLRKCSLPDGSVLVIIDETIAAKNPNCDQYEYFENIDFEGGDIKQVNQEFDEILKEADQLKSCVAFNECGWLKSSLSNPRIIKNSRFGTYIKKSYLKENPQFHEHISNYIRSFDQPIDIGVVDTIKSFDMDMPIIKIFKRNHTNMFNSLRVGFDLLVNLYSVKYLVNIDSDTIHEPNWLSSLLKSYDNLNKFSKYRPLVLSGFNASKKKNLRVMEDYVVKENLGGINLFFDTPTYMNYVRGTLVNVGWDLQLSKIIRKNNGALIALRHSVIQHIGTEGMWSNPGSYDYSSTFIKKEPNLRSSLPIPSNIIDKFLNFFRLLKSQAL